MATNANPFDIASGGLVNSALAPAASAQTPSNVATPSDVVAPSSPTAATGSGSVAQGTASLGSAMGYDAAQAKGSNWDVDSNQTVAGQLGKITKDDSPVMQQARTSGLQTAASRGLVNSSIGVGAAEGAVLDRALQIATPDAATYANSSKYNADVANNMALANQGATNSAKQFTAGATNQQTQANQNATNQQTLANQSASNQQLQQDTQNKQQSALAGYDAATKAAFTNYDAAVKAALTNYDGALKVSMQNADAQTKVQLQSIDSQTRIGLGNIEANYKTLMQANQGATDLYSTTIQQITAIMGNKDLDAAAKQTLINQQTSFLQSGLTMIGKMNNLGLDQLLTFAPGVSGASTSPVKTIDNPDKSLAQQIMEQRNAQVGGA